MWIKSLFNKDTSYAEAQQALLNVENCIQKIGMTFPDITSFDFDLVKNKWKDLPDNVSYGVSMMGLHLSNEYRSTLVYFSANSYINPHLHSTECEVIQIIEGTAYDKISNVSLTKGDVYIIPKGIKHHIVADNECYMYIMFTENTDFLKIPNIEPNVANEYIKNFKISKASKI